MAWLADWRKPARLQEYERCAQRFVAAVRGLGLQAALVNLNQADFAEDEHLTRVELDDLVQGAFQMGRALLDGGNADGFAGRRRQTSCSHAVRRGNRRHGPNRLR